MFNDFNLFTREIEGFTNGRIYLDPASERSMGRWQYQGRSGWEEVADSTEIFLLIWIERLESGWKIYLQWETRLGNFVFWLHNEQHLQMEKKENGYTNLLFFELWIMKPNESCVYKIQVEVDCGNTISLVSYKAHHLYIPSESLSDSCVSMDRKRTKLYGVWWWDWRGRRENECEKEKTKILEGNQMEDMRGDMRVVYSELVLRCWCDKSDNNGEDKEEWSWGMDEIGWGIVRLIV